MIRVGKLNESVDTYINPEDKTTLSKVKKSIHDYPVGTYLKYSTKGPINAISQYVHGLYKVGLDKWVPYSSIMGASTTTSYTTDQVLKNLVDTGAKNIGLKLGGSTNE